MSVAFNRTLVSVATDSTRRLMVGFFISILMLGSFLVWFFGAEVCVYETTNLGRLEQRQSNYIIQASVSGVVTVSNLRLDKTVQPGDVLAEMNADKERLLLKEEKAKLEAFRILYDSQQKVILAQRQALQTDINEGTIAFEESKKKIQKNKIAKDFFADKAQRQNRLFQSGSTAEYELLKSKAEALNSEVDSELSSINANKVKAKYLSKINERLSTIERLNSESTDVAGKMEVSKQTIQTLEFEIERRVIRAPVAGKIAQAAELHSGSFLQPGDRIASILASGELIVVAQYTPTQAVGRIRPGQQARVRCFGFPWMQYGDLGATVLLVATEPSEGLLRVELALEAQHDSSIPKLHGMPAEIKIEVEKTTPVTLVIRAIGKGIKSPGDVAGG